MHVIQLTVNHTVASCWKQLAKHSNMHMVKLTCYSTQLKYQIVTACYVGG